MTVLHLIRPESGAWQKEVAAAQARAGDRVVVLSWHDGSDEQVACEVLAHHGDEQWTPGTTVTYDRFLDLLFESERVFYW